MKRLLLISLLMTGCSAVTPIPTEPNVIDYGDGCKVTVYQTEADALKRGPIVEMCVIEGTSAWSYNHTPETAIRKHAKKACECGADKIFVQARSAAAVGVATASMVAFRWE